jgi:hypothetical protein
MLVYVFAASVPVPFISGNLRTPTKGSQAVIAHSTIKHDGS